MTDIDSQLKPYTCHKKVRAAEITSVGSYVTNSHGLLVRAVTLNNDLTVDLPDELFSRFVPSRGDFLVVYDDGYRSFSPRQQFLEGYTADGETFSDIVVVACGPNDFGSAMVGTDAPRMVLGLEVAKQNIMDNVTGKRTVLHR